MPTDPGRILPPSTLVACWQPMFDDGSTGVVYALRDLGDGRIAAGGQWDYLLGPDGVATVAQPNFAVFTKADRAPTAFAPGFDGPVRCLLVVGATLYVGGLFSHAGATPRGGGAAFDLAGGDALLPWDPRVDTAKVYTLESNAAGTVVYVGGDFAVTVGVQAGIQGTVLWNTGAVDATTGDLWHGTATDPDTGAPLPWTAPCNRPCRRLVRSPDGAWLYVCAGIEDPGAPGVGTAGEPGYDAGKGSTCRASVDDGRVDPTFDIFALDFYQHPSQDVLASGVDVYTCGYFGASTSAARNHLAKFDDIGALRGFDAAIAEHFGSAGLCLALASDGLTVFMGADLDGITDDASPLRLLAGYDATTGARVWDIFPIIADFQRCFAVHLEDTRLWVGGKALTPPDGTARALLVYDAAGDISGDPYVTTVRGVTFEFAGRHGRVYDFYSAPSGLRVLPRIAALPPDGAHTCVSGVDVLLPGGGKVVVLAGGKVHVLAADGHHVAVDVKACTLDAPNHLGCTTWQPHPLMGVAHLNVSVPARPADAGDATGLMVDGDKPDRMDADYEVREPF